MQFEHIIQIFNDATLKEKEEILRNALKQDPIVALTIFNASSLEVMYQLIVNLSPFLVVDFFRQCWEHLGYEESDRFDYISNLFIKLWESYPDSTYATHSLIWIFLSDNSSSISLINRFILTLKEAKYPIPENLLLQEQEPTLPVLPL